ncbi:MAG: hypothetical protein ACYCXG_05315 [Acidiferrobacter sp.]
MKFNATRVLVFSNFDVDAILIRAMQQEGDGHLLWNDSGFGSNDAGRGRDRQKPARFNKERPIDIDKPVDFVTEEIHKLVDLLADVKKGLPYVFRYQTGEEGSEKASRRCPPT